MRLRMPLPEYAEVLMKMTKAEEVAHELVYDRLYWGVTIAQLIGGKQADITKRFTEDLVAVLKAAKASPQT